jgi:hypothetical protein
MTDASLATVAITQRRFVADSPKLQLFIERYRAAGTVEPRFVVHASAAAPDAQ